MSFLEIIADVVQQAILLTGFMCFFTLMMRFRSMSGKDILVGTMMVIMSFLLGVLLFN